MTSSAPRATAASPAMVRLSRASACETPRGKHCNHAIGGDRDASGGRCVRVVEHRPTIRFALPRPRAGGVEVDDDGRPDSGLEVANPRGERVHRHSRARGHQLAVELRCTYCAANL